MPKTRPQATSVLYKATSPARRVLHTAAIALLTLALALSPNAASVALADVRSSDIVATQTVEERGLSLLNAPSVDANYVYVVDENGKVYFQRDATHQTNIASITKVMTALVALEYGSLDQTISVSSAAASVGESSAWLLAGDELTLLDALKGLMLPSGNDAAIAIAESVGQTIAGEGGAEGTSDTSDSAQASAAVGASDGSDSVALEAFVNKMNETASELGCENTWFTNPHGLDIGQYAADMHSCAKDVALICAKAMENQTFREIVKTKEASLSVTRGGNLVSVEVESTDEMLGAYEGACGIKTGFTNAAGACFAAACERDGLTVFAIVLDSSSEAQRFTDTETLFDWVFSSVTDYQLAQSSEYVSSTAFNGSEVPVVAQAALGDYLDKTVPVTLADPSASVNVSSIFGNVSQEIHLNEITGSVSAGDIVGSAVFYQQNQVIAKVDLVACESVDAPNALDALFIAFQRLFASLSGQATQAQTVIYNQTPMLLEKSQQETYN